MDLVREFNMQNVKIIDARPPFIILPKTPENKDNPFDSKINQVTNIDKELYKSTLGTAVLTDIQFTGNTWKDNYGNTQSFNTLKFETILVSVNQSKNIVTTDIQGRDGTVKEYIGLGDYSINISGIITGANGHYPLDEVKNLKRMLDANIAINVVSWYLQNLDIDNLVIKDYEIGQDLGGYSYQRFTISALSDTPQEIAIYN